MARWSGPMPITESTAAAHHATLSDFLIARVEEQVADLAQRPVPPVHPASPSKSLAARLNWLDDRLSRPLAHHRLATLVDVPMIYILRHKRMTSRTF